MRRSASRHRLKIRVLIQLTRGNSMETISGTIKKWTTQTPLTWERYQRDRADHTTVKFELYGEDNETYTGWWDAYDRTEVVALSLYARGTIDKKARPRVAEFLARKSGEIPFGGVELNFENGVLRFHDSVGFSEGIPSVAMLDRMLKSGTATLDKILPEVMALAHFNLSADVFSPLQDHDLADLARVLAQEGAEDKKPNAALLDLPSVEPVRIWADSVKAALQKPDEANWEDIGRAVVVVGLDGDHSTRVMRAASAYAGLHFIQIAEDMVADMASLSAFCRFAPVLIYLQAGDWSKASKDDGAADGDTEKASAQFRRRLIDWLDDFDPERPVLVATNARTIGDLVEDLKHVDRFDRFLFIGEPTLAERGRAFIERIGSTLCAATLLRSPEKIGKLISDVTDGDNRHEKLMVRRLQRLSRREARVLTFVDLVRVTLYGLSEEAILLATDPEALRHIAVHEAGHAVMAILDSDGSNVPEYSTIIGGGYFSGAVVESMSYKCTKEGFKTFADFRHSVRIGLAGRAAEEIVFGSEDVTTGAANDLEKAARHTMFAFASWGFAPEMLNGGSATNLAVIFDKASNSEQQHVEMLTREFLANEYRHVCQRLQLSVRLIDAVTEKLLSDHVIDQTELTRIHHLIEPVPEFTEELGDELVESPQIADQEIYSLTKRRENEANAVV